MAHDIAVGGDPNFGEPVMISISLLRSADSPRLAGEDPNHVKVLTEAGSETPPILVHRETMRVIDGMHRLRAAMARGDNNISIRTFDGDVEAAFVLAVRANIDHGLPLSFADRIAAARRIIASHPNWSDRAIAKTVGISPKSVGNVRAEVLGERSRVAERVGADGRERPPNSSPEGRLRAAELLAQNPNASLREIAKAAAVSLGTVNDVRKRIACGEDPVLPSQRGNSEKPPLSQRRHKKIPVLRKRRVTMLHDLKQDPSLRYSESGRRLLRTLHENFTSVTKWPELIETIPDHQAHIVAELAEHFADQWRELADQIRSKACLSGAKKRQ